MRRMDRRRFLKGSALAAAALALGGDGVSRRLLLAASGGGASFVVPPNSLTVYRNALGAIEDVPLDIVCIGDSITEAYRASTLSARWVEHLLASLHASHGSGTNVSVYRPGDWGTPLDPPAMALPWTLVNEAQTVVYGLGRKANVISSGASMSITETCTGFSIVYARGPSGSTFGSFKYAVDGGATTTVSAVNATVQGGRLVTVTGLAPGSHTVAITPDTDHVPIEGIMFYNGNETNGIRVWEGGHSGYKASDYIDGSNPHWIDLLTTVQPSLVTIMLGRNEWVTSVSVATFIANLTTLIANVRSAVTPDPSILVVSEMTGNYTPGLPWSDYVTAIASLVASDGMLAYVDLVPAFGGYTVPPSGPLYNADLAHPNDAGHAEIASELFALLD